MGREFKIIKETASISATMAEFAAVDRFIRAEISSAGFLSEYDSLLLDIVNTYRVVIDTFEPLLVCCDLQLFREKFNTAFADYEQQYQPALSAPRVNAEFTFEKYLQFRKLKEVQTGYPVLKAAFARLHDLIDKWIDNDIWLAMSIDTVFKMLFLVLQEVRQLQQADIEEAFNLYFSCVGCLEPYVNMMRSYLDILETPLQLISDPA